MNVIELKNYKMYHKRWFFSNWISSKNNYIKIYFIDKDRQIVKIKNTNIIYEIETKVSILHESTQFDPCVKNIIYIVCKNIKNKNIECNSINIRKRFFDRIYDPNYKIKLKLKLNPDSFKFKYEPNSYTNNKVLI